MAENLVFRYVEAYSIGSKEYSLVISIPREVREELGTADRTNFKIMIDDRVRIIYEPIR